MKALILAGGAGTRLRPITHTRAKQLVPVANKPILFYGIEAMVAAGITEIGVIIGDTGPEVRAALGDGSAFGAKITYIPQDAPLGLAHCVLIAGDFLGDDDFVMYLGDNLLEQDLAAFVAAFEAARRSDDPPAAQILLKQVPDPHRFGIATLDADGHVVELVEKPDDPPSDLALVGVYLFDATIHDAVRGDRAVGPRRAGDHRRHPVADHQRPAGAHRAAHRLVDRHRQADPAARGQPAAAREDRHARSTARSTRSRRSTDGSIVAEGAEIVNSTIRGPVAIGRDTRIVDSFIGPFSAIGNGCEVVHSEIEHSVVMDGSKILQHPPAGGQPDRSRSGRRADVAAARGRCA